MLQVRMSVNLLFVLFFVKVHSRYCDCSYGVWTNWFDDGPCVPSWKWLESFDVDTQKFTVKQMNYTCGMCGRQVQTRNCISASRGCGCDEDAVRVVNCDPTPCEANEYHVYPCCSPYEVINGKCDLYLKGKFNVLDPYENVTDCDDPVGHIGYCNCNNIDGWSEWQTILECPENADIIYKENGKLENYTECGTSQKKVESRTCLSEANNCPCSGDKYRWSYCYSDACSYPLRSCFFEDHIATSTGRAFQCMESSYKPETAQDTEKLPYCDCKHMFNSDTIRSWRTSELNDCTPVNFYYICNLTETAQTRVTLSIFDHGRNQIGMVVDCASALKSDRMACMTCDRMPVEGQTSAHALFESKLVSYVTCTYEKDANCP